MEQGHGGKVGEKGQDVKAMNRSQKVRKAQVKRRKDDIKRVSRFVRVLEEAPKENQGFDDESQVRAKNKGE